MGARGPEGRYGLIADVHANLQALDATLEWLDGRAVDAVYCLGDVVGYGGDPSACVERVRSRCAGTVRGNHDAALVDASLLQWFNPHARAAIERQAEILDPADREWLAGLPWTIEVGEVALVHSGFADPPAFDYVTGAWEARRELRATEACWGFLGHTHVPSAWRLSPEGDVEARGLEEGASRLDGDARWLVNPGAVGQPRDGDPRPACAVFEPATATLEWVRLDYDLAAAQAAIRASGMPEFEAERLARGR